MKFIGKRWPLLLIGAVVAFTAVAMIESSILNPSEPAGRGNIYKDLKRFNEAFTAVSKYYVEDVESKKLIDGAISGMLESLDPHSIYIPKEQLEDVTERFEGHFYGIGIEFVMIKKWPTIIAPIAGSPSDRLGLRSGDQIVKIEGKSTYNMDQQQVVKSLRGAKGTKVNVTIRRPGEREPFEVTIVRDKIPIYSIEPALMVDDRVGYVRIRRFSKTTADELEHELSKLESQGMHNLILDLRSNAGGFLEQAVAVADKFLERGRKIVYTRGRIPQANDEFFAVDDDHHEQFPLIILIDHGSASASEIVAGACQDWDRALVVGESSFGKGLVQSQIGLMDGSAIRVTTAKYYTPSGRLIQRPYENGNFEEYLTEAYDDIDPNAISDSTKNKPAYKTNAGRVVYGGGGISPDITLKWQRYSRFTYELAMNRAFFEYASDYASKAKNLTSDFEAFKTRWTPSEALLADFRRFIKAKGIAFNEESWNSDLNNIKQWLKKEIALHLWDRQRSAEVEIHEDPQMKEVLRLFPQAERLAAMGDNRGGRQIPR